MAIIYCVTSPDGTSYIGQTCQKNVNIRWKGHISAAKKACRRNWKRQGCIVFWKALIEFGYENFTWEILLLCNTNDVDAYEVQFIKQYNTLSPNGYNQTSGGNGKKLICKETRLRISIATKEAMRKLGPLLKRTELGKDLPINVGPYQYGTRQGFRIQAHDLCKHKEFDICIYGTMAAAKLACLEYFTKILSKEIVHSNPIKNGGNSLAPGIYIDKITNKYYVQKLINKHRYYKLFVKHNDNTQNLIDAQIFLDIVLINPLNQTIPIINNIPIHKQIIEDHVDNISKFIINIIKNKKRTIKLIYTKNKTREENYNDALAWLNANK